MKAGSSIEGRQRFLLFAVALLLVAAPTFGQDTSQTSKDQQGTDSPGQTTGQPQQPDATSITPPDTSAATLPDNLQFSKVGSSNFLEAGIRGPIHLGPIYADSASITFASGGGVKLNSQNQLASTTDTFVLFQTTVVYDKLFQNGRLAIQYDPQLAIVNGQVQSDFSNQFLSLSTARNISPRLSLGVADSFSYLNGNVLFGGVNANVNLTTGQAFQQPFLQTSETFLNNVFTVTAGYKLNGRDQLNFSPYFQYENTSVQGNTQGQIPNPDQDAYTYGGTLNLSHSLSETKSVGAYVSFDHRQITGQQAAQQNTLYESFGVSYSQHFSPTLVLALSLGAGTSGSSGAVGSGSSQRLWTTTGTVTVRKDFVSSSISADYYRGISIGPVLSGGYTNRVDGTYSRSFHYRWQMSLGASYQGDFGIGSTNTLSGSYVNATASYRLARRLNWTSMYSYRFESQSAGGTNIGSNFFSTGITWTIGRDSGVISPVI